MSESILKYNGMRPLSEYDIVLLNMAEDAFKKYKEDFKKYSGVILNSPVFVFNDKKECEYFKMLLLKQYSKKGNSVFLNLQTETLANFLFDALKEQNPEYKDKKLLSSDILKDMIVYALSEENNKLIEENKELKDYLTSNTIDSENRDSINLVNLYDIASTLSKLYVEYSVNFSGRESSEYKKNNLLNDSIAQALKNSSNLVDNSWQIALYQKLQDIFKIDKEDDGDYVSLAFLNSEVVDIKLSRSVYYFENQNSIIPSLFKEIIEKLSSNDMFHKCSIKSMNDKDLKMTNKDKFQKLISAPSKIREIEGVHAEICKLVYGNKGKTEIDNLDDILILVPDMNEYRSAIHQVFSISKDAEIKNGFRYPYIPVDMGSIAIESQVSNALQILFRVAEKGYYTRKDFFSLLAFSTIVEKFGITNDDLSSYKEIIEDMNVYRNRPNKPNDWEEGRKQVLLSLLMDKDEQFLELTASNTLFGMGDECVAKFSAFINLLEKWCVIFKCSDKSDKCSETGFKEFYDNKKKGDYQKDCRVLKINRNEDYKNNNNQAKEYTPDTIDKIIEVLKELFLNDAFVGDDEIKNENKILRSVICKIYELKNLYSSKEKIPYYIFKETILDSIKEISLTDDLSKKGGVRVAKIDLVNPIKCKYLFLVGFSSNAFCIEKSENVLDIRTTLCKQFSADLQQKQLCVLNAQIGLADKFWVSFVNKDLKKDEDFYLSSEIEEILKETYDFEIPSDNDKSDGKKSKYLALGINWRQEKDTDILWTSREYRNMEYSKKCNEPK